MGRVCCTIGSCCHHVALLHSQDRRRTPGCVLQVSRWMTVKGFYENCCLCVLLHLTGISFSGTRTAISLKCSSQITLMGHLFVSEEGRCWQLPTVLDITSCCLLLPPTDQCRYIYLCDLLTVPFPLPPPTPGLLPKLAVTFGGVFHSIKAALIARQSWVSKTFFMHNWSYDCFTVWVSISF